MGQKLCHALRDEDFQSFKDTGSSVHSLIVALNYDYSPKNALTGIVDGHNMVKICRHAGCEDIVMMTDDGKVGNPNFPTRDRLLKAVAEVGGRCRPGDYFLFFYAGHGENVPDTNGDEDDGMDEAFVTPSQQGKLAHKFCLIDDDFALALDALSEGVKILVITDCCHSGSIVDIDSHAYDHEIVHIAAARDDEVSEDTGHGGILTESLRHSVRDLSVYYGTSEFSIQEVFDKVQSYAGWVNQTQHLGLNSANIDPEMAAWPLCFPWWEYMHWVKNTA